MGDGATMVFTGTADQLFAMADAAMDKVRQFHDQAAAIPPVEFRAGMGGGEEAIHFADAAETRALARTAELDRATEENARRWDTYARGETQAAAGADTLAESTGRAHGSMRSMMLVSQLLLSPLGMNTEAFRALHIAMIAMNTGGQGITSMFASLKAGATAALTAIAGLSAPALIAIGAIAAAAAVITGLELGKAGNQGGQRRTGPHTKADRRNEGHPGSHQESVRGSGADQRTPESRRGSTRQPEEGADCSPERYGQCRQDDD